MTPCNAEPVQRVLKDVRLLRPARAPVVVLALALAAGLSGCGSAQQGPGGGAPTSATSPPTDQPTVVVPTTKPTPSVSITVSVTVSGIPAAGVERGCLVLGGYLLLGGDCTLLMSGRALDITGMPDPSLVTTCQQGVPLVIRSVVPRS